MWIERLLELIDDRRTRRIERRIREEIAVHVDYRRRELEAEGLSASQADRVAHQRLGDVDRHVREGITVMHGRRDGPVVRSLVGLDHDLRGAWRTLRRKPGFSATVIATTAIAVAGASIVWALAHATVFRLLPFPDPEQLVRLGERHTDMPESVVASYLSYATWRDQAPSFAGVAATRPQDFNLEAAADPLRISGARVSWTYFDVMGVAPLLGRVFTPADDTLAGQPVAMLGERLWRSAFAADQNVIGRDIRVDGVPRTVVGVLPALESLPSLAWSDLFVPLALDDAQARANDNRWLLVTGRLRPEVTIEQARAEVDTLQRNLQNTSPATHEAWGSTVRPLQEWLVGRFRPVADALLAIGLLMAVSCGFNLTALMLVQATERRQELGVRLALGADRHRVVRLTVVEGAALGLLGAAVGLGLTTSILRLLVTAAPMLQIPRLAAVDLPASHALAFAGSCVLGVVCLQTFTVLATGVRATAEPMGAHSRGASATRRVMRMQRALTAAQLAMALTGTVAATLLARSFDRVQRTDPGFSSNGVLSLQLALPAPRYGNDEARSQFVRRLLGELEQIPRLSSVGVVQHLPLGLSRGRVGIDVADDESQPGQEAIVQYNTAGGQYFEALKIPLVEGRWFTEAETWSSSANVVIVNEALARRYVRGSPIGQSLRLADVATPLRIVGMAGNVRRENLEDEPEPELFVPLANGAPATFSVVLRTQGEPLTLVSSARAVVKAADPLLPVANVMTQQHVVARAVAPRRMQTVVVVTLALVTLVLAAVGVFGLIARSVAGRGREFGVRLALGAHADDILRMVLREGLALAFLAVVVGGALTLIVVRSLEPLLYQTNPLDPVSLVGAAIALVALALAAALWPAYCAARTNTADILRQER